MKTTVTDVTIVLRDCATTGVATEVIQTLKDAGLEELQILPECVITGYINSHMLAALKLVEHIGYIRAGHTYEIDIPDTEYHKLCTSRGSGKSAKA
jgi:hypothetical protein